MKEKWNKKTIAEYAQALRSPFDGVGQKQGLAGAVERIRKLIGKKKAIQ